MRTVTKRILVFAGLLAAPSLTDSHVRLIPVAEAGSKPDPRLHLLEQFFRRRECPAQDLAADFILAADTNRLDWRLLPSIAVVESGGGKNAHKNNLFGWDSCRQGFPSLRAGIHVVARRLGKSRLYRNKETTEILRTYNSVRADYPQLVKSLMRKLGPAVPEAATD
ncbi:MAG: glucosaminidase domain-containing protein [Bryobacterales bacterium]|nr:glucosaminidase domain-containing protein [Bryobacterales bacterium]